MAVLPALTGKGYEGLEIGDGALAATRFLDMAFGKMPGEESAATRAALLEYCRLDTLGMIEILRILEATQ